MNRRGFLGLLAGAVATPVLAPLAKLLPVPTPVKAVIGEYADYCSVSDLAFDSAISYNVRYTLSLRHAPSSVIRLRNIKVPE